MLHLDPCSKFSAAVRRQPYRSGQRRLRNLALPALLLAVAPACDTQPDPTPPNQSTVPPAATERVLPDRPKAAPAAKPRQPTVAGPDRDEERVRHKFAKVGVAEILIPGTEPPSSGWPVMLLLHANGGTREDMRDFAPLVADAGFAAVSVSAPIKSMSGEGYLWPPPFGFKMGQQYLESSIAAFVESPDLDFQRTFLFGSREGAWTAILLLGVHPELYAGAIALGPHPKEDSLPNASAPAGRPLAVVAAGNDSRGVFVASHFQRLWNEGQVPFRLDLIAAEENRKQSWLLTTVELLNWMQQKGQFRTGKLAESLPEYPDQMPMGR